MYTTISKVREFSGFDDTTNISNNIVLGKINFAESIFDSAASYRYSLPLKYRKKNTITFSGTGTGADTMTITINSVDYEIAITDELTDSEAADLFRIAAAGSDDFMIIDYLGSGETITIISLTDSTDSTTANAEVTISSSVTTEGITATKGTIIDSYPPIVEQITTEIAAALLLIDNYGIEAQNTPKDGNIKMDNINEVLQKIQGVHESGQIIKILDEITKTELTYSTESLPLFIPSNATDEDTDNPTNYKVSINSEF